MHLEAVVVQRVINDLIIGDNIMKYNVFFELNIEYQTELELLFNDVPYDLHKKLLLGHLVDFTTEEIIKLPTSLLYFLPVSKLNIFIKTFSANISILLDKQVGCVIRYSFSVTFNCTRRPYTDSKEDSSIYFN